MWHPPGMPFIQDVTHKAFVINKECLVSPKCSLLAAPPFFGCFADLRPLCEMTVEVESDHLSVLPRKCLLQNIQVFRRSLALRSLDFTVLQEALQG